jgi:hypothetical protein
LSRAVLFDLAIFFIHQGIEFVNAGEIFLTQLLNSVYCGEFAMA